MSFFPSRTTFLQIGNLTIQWYAVLIVGGAFLAYYFAKKNLKEYRNIDVNDFFDDTFIVMLWVGVIGARLWYCVFNDFSFYFSNPVNIIRIWDGGLAIHGGLIFGALAVLFMCKKHNVPFIKVADSIFPTVLLAQGIGRWGNYINQECHGGVVSEDYFNGILSFLKEGMHINGIYYEPLFFYESLLCILGFILINFLLKKTAEKRGQLTGAYLIWYGVVRFFIEGRRTDSLYMGTLKTAQVTSIIFVIVGLALYFGMYDKVFKPKKPTIVFDVDGTIQDSTPAIWASYIDTYKHFGYDPKDFTDEIKAYVLGPALKETFEKLLPNENADKCCEYFRQVNLEELHKTLKPMPHATEVLQTLKDEGYHMAVLTTRGKDSLAECLKICGFENFFDAVIRLEDVKNVKPDPEGLFILKDKYKMNSADVIMVGDSVADVKAGDAFGAYTIAYLSNEGKKAKLIASNPNRQISDLNEILDIVKEKHYFTYNLK